MLDDSEEIRKEVKSLGKKSGLRNAPAGHRAKGPSGKGRSNASKK